MAADEYKALTVVNIPFIDERYEPGKMIPASSFDKSVEAAEAANPDADIPSAEEQIQDLMHWGSISDDPDAPLHPDHEPSDPNAVTLAKIQQMAQSMVETLEGSGQSVPSELRVIADLSQGQVQSIDQGRGDNSE